MLAAIVYILADSVEFGRPQYYHPFSHAINWYLSFSQNDSIWILFDLIVSYLKSVPSLYCIAGHLFECCQWIDCK